MFASKVSRETHGFQGVVLLGLLTSCSAKEGETNPYKQSLANITDELALSVSMAAFAADALTHALAFAFGEVRAVHGARAQICTALTNAVGVPCPHRVRYVCAGHWLCDQLDF